MRNSTSFLINLQAYPVALRLFDFAQSVAGNLEDSLMAMVYPSDSHPDDNPIFVLCRNDTCSFTWTGEEHIHQVRGRGKGCVDQR